jgi:hypothetical protein
MQPGAIPMNPSAAHPAVKQGKQSAMEVAATDQGVKCSPQFVPSAAKKQKCPSSLEGTGQSIAAIATPSSDQAVSDSLDNNGQWRLGYSPAAIASF